MSAGAGQSPQQLEASGVPTAFADAVREARRPRTVRRRLRIGLGIAGVVALAAAAAAVPRTFGGSRPVPLGSLAPGSCFRFLPAGDPRQDPASSDGRQVIASACSEPHHGEVVAQTAIDPGRIRLTAELPRAASDACRETFADYNPDYWAPAAAIVPSFVPPASKDYAEHPGVTCLYENTATEVTGSLRADPARLTPAQRQYLDTVRAYNVLSSDGLDTRDWARDSDLTAWAGEMAAVEQRTVDGLERTGAPAGAEQPFATVLERHRAAAAAWQAASAMTGPRADILRQISRARDAETASMEAARAVRAVLGLTTAIRPRGYSL
ncbi:hypothetical protein GCM10010441_36540 [Kitasatospora paracochleata]|uniref:Septum formation-related domain-containing protein n=1 Tax=Kitasatospora paracochleata TaxID=58354 RepID=A0ABT1JAC4_9ACTN|nr:hypothetical protein [Kitasatospora paracochleata]MCP2314409.1 hypothetical protein [Kitasatospora paracochleata]